MIGFLIYSLGGGGAERAVSNLANELAGMGEKVFIYIFDDTYKIAYDLNPRITVKICAVSPGRGLIYRMWYKIHSLRQMLRKDSITVLFAFMISMIPYALLAKSWKCKVIGAERTNPMLHDVKRRFIIKFLSPFCDGFIFQTEGAKMYYPYCVKKKAEVIANPVLPISQRKEKIPGIHICAAGRKAVYKDFSTLLKAFFIFIKEYPGSSLTIFGDKELEDSLQGEIKELELQSKVCFRGFVKNLPEELSAYTMFVFSSKAEGMPNVLMEAMAAGMPCVATDCKYGPGELIQNYVNGILVEVGNASEMAEAMKKFGADEKFRLQIGNEAEKLKEKYSRATVTEQYIAYIKKIKKKEI